MKILFKSILLIILIVAVNSCVTTTNSDNFTTTSKYFYKEQVKLIMESGGSKPMRVFQINQHPDSLLLRSKSEDIIPDFKDLTQLNLIDRMYATVNDSVSLGVGIAAPQVGIAKNIIWVQRFDKVNEPFEVYFNPKIIQYSKQTQICREGCLSVPDIMDTMEVRSHTILLEYDKLDGTHKIEMVEGFTAVIFQHEFDHLNGVLFIDYADKKSIKK